MCHQRPFSLLHLLNLSETVPTAWNKGLLSLLKIHPCPSKRSLCPPGIYLVPPLGVAAQGEGCILSPVPTVP